MANPTPAQLKTVILADPTAAAFPNTAQGNFDCANYLNSASSGPVVTIYLPFVSTDVLKSAIDWGSGVSGFQSLSQSARDAYFALSQGTGVDATNANIRAGFASIFPAASATALNTAAQRVATKVEAAFTTSNVCSCFGYKPSANDVNTALAS